MHFTARVWAGVRMPSKGLFPLAVFMMLILPLPVLCLSVAAHFISAMVIPAPF